MFQPIAGVLTHLDNFQPSDQVNTQRVLNWMAVQTNIQFARQITQEASVFAT